MWPRRCQQGAALVSTLRIIGGTEASRRLRAPRSAQVRPTSDRVKETLFGILGERVGGARFLDLYAGSGSVGLEALSRGASQVTLVDRGAAAIRCIRENLDALGLPGAEVVRMKLPDGLRSARLAAAPFDLIFLDPPYAGELVSSTLAVLGECPALTADGGEIIAQHDSRRAVPERAGPYLLRRQRKAGSTTLTFYSR